MKTIMALRLAFDVFVLGLFVFAFTYAMGFRELAKTLPITVAGAGVVCTGMLVLRDLYVTLQVVKQGREYVLPEEDPNATLISAARSGGPLRPFVRRALGQSGWIVGFLLAIWLLSMPVGSLLFVIAFLRFETEMSWRQALIGGVATIVALVAFAEVMNLAFPPSAWNPLERWIG